jgi:hypothetical protein
MIEDSPTGFVPGTVVFGNAESEADGVIEFEMMKAGAFNFNGVFSYEAGIPDETRVMLYGLDGRRATSQVDTTSGYFQVTVPEVPPGRIPYILTISSPNYDSNQNRLLQGQAKQEQRNLQPPSINTPCLFWVSNPCDLPALSFTLSWDGATSDVDLHVYEPSGKHIFYGSPEGDDGYLDRDDTDGFGPEHYFALETTPGDYGVQVVSFSMNSDASVLWMLTARKEGEVLWTETGVFLASGEMSDLFVVSILDSGQRFLQDGPPSCTLRRKAPGSCQDQVDNPICPIENSGFWCFFVDCSKKADLYTELAALADTKNNMLSILGIFWALNRSPSDGSFANTAALIGLAAPDDLQCVHFFLLEKICDFFERRTYALAAGAFIIMVNLLDAAQANAGFLNAATASGKATAVADYMYNSLQYVPNQIQALKDAVDVTDKIARYYTFFDLDLCCVGITG